MPDTPPAPAQKRPGGATTMNASVPTRSALMPFATANRQVLLRKGYFGPAAATAGLIAVLNLIPKTQPGLFIKVFSVYLGLAGYYAVYRMCGKQRAWYASAAVALATAAIVGSPLFILYELVFRHLLPGDAFAMMAQMEQGASVSLPRQFITFFFGAGLLEELVKATPIFLVLAYTKRLASPTRERAGVTEPLDGIVLGAASGLGFTLIETLGQYVPHQIAEITQKTGSEGIGFLFGLQLAITRVGGEVFGHIGYAAIFGYSIGLAALFPAARWRILPIGYLAAATLHGLWDTFCDTHPFLQLPLMLLTWSVLVACVLKARQLSPERSHNFATEVASGSLLARLAPATSAPVTPAVAPVTPAVSTPAVSTPALAKPVAATPVGREAPAAAPAPAFTLRVGTSTLRLDVGALLYERDLPGLRSSRADGVVAEVGRNPKDPSILGLTNRSQQPWTVETAPGAAPGRVITAGQTIRLTQGLRLALGTASAVVA